MKLGKYVSNSGFTYEVISNALNIETHENAVIYRKSDNKNEILVCSEKWWNSQNFVSIEDYQKHGITKYSSSEDKIKLYMSLFIGRSDVYAKRWESKNGKCGYSPVCLNEWNPLLCLKPAGKCSNCNSKNYATFVYDVIENHLKGAITAGIYPLLQDESCRFLAIDFDDKNWEKDILTVFYLCEKHSIPSYIECSRSGNGGHLWIFFSENIPASLARKLGSCILTSAMNERHEIKFSSYDRFFPNQDTLPKGGFGNLIALPLQKLPRKNNNSVFVDENLHPYDDQWKFLSTVKLLSEPKVNALIKKLNIKETCEIYEDTSEKPWEKKNITLSKNDFPKSINIILSNMIYVEKTGISQKGIACLKRFATFKNPEFYKAQAMRLSTYNKPRIISVFDDADEYIGLPRGLFDILIQTFIDYNIDINIIDKTNSGRNISVDFNGKLRPEQEIAKQTMANKSCGILSASTAFGKTVVGASLIAEQKVNTLVLVHRTNLLKQWIERLNEFLIINENPPIEYTPKGRKRKKSVIGQISGAKNNPSGIIDVAVMQSLISNGNVNNIVKQYGMVIVDECHHVSAFTFEQILKTTNAKYVYGLTATPTRQDGHQPIIYMQCGPIAYKANNNLSSDTDSFERYMIPRFTSFKNSSDKITDLYSAISENELRNQAIIKDCIKAVSDGKTPIILTERTNHVDILAGKLQNYNVIKLVGGMSNKQYNETMNRLNSIPDNESLVIIATGKYIGEGFDFSRLDTLLLAMPISWKGTLQQYAGRLHRTHANKTEVTIYDYIDINVPMLEKMYQKRLKGYRGINYKIKTEDTVTENEGSIFDNTNFMELFATDITSAKREIIISTPFVSKRIINKMLHLFDTVADKITVITRPIDDYTNEIGKQRISECINILECNYINVRFKSGLHQKFAVIDQRLIWYGSINLLSFGKSEECIMRLESAEIADELLNSI